MKLLIHKPKRYDDGLTPSLLQSFLQTQGLYCTVNAHCGGLWTFNNAHNFYDFQVLTRFGIGTGYEDPKSAKLNLIAQLNQISAEQGWRVSFNVDEYFEDRFPPKITGIRFWVYADDEES